MDKDCPICSESDTIAGRVLTYKELLFFYRGLAQLSMTGVWVDDNEYSEFCRWKNNAP
jgi:hypothetical protein